MHETVLGFPIWLRATHWINAFFIGFIIRSGIQILAALPKLYWSDDATPGTEWLKFTKKELPADRVWTSLEEEVEAPSWLAQPGGNDLGMGRHWHFFSILCWVLNGLLYAVLLFPTGEWRRLIPTNWSIFPDAWHTFLTYASFHLPPAGAFHPYDPLQQLAYAAVVFLLAPFAIATGAAQSPAIEAHFPWYVWLWGGRQRARSLHFLALLAFVAFIVVHTVLVVLTGFSRNLDAMVLGQAHGRQSLAVALGSGFIVATLAIYALTSWYSLRHPRQVQHALGRLVNGVRRALFIRWRSRQHYPPSDISPFFRVNGYPPETDEYAALLKEGFAAWCLKVDGLVERPLSLSLDDLRALPRTVQITKHNCIQGWTAVASWGGVPMAEILARCIPLPHARYAVFTSYQDDGHGRPFYESLDLDLVGHPQTILSDEMNGRPLPVAHGAPVRLRVETQLGFKMVKWIRRLELVDSYKGLGEGSGGTREDTMYYDPGAGI
jgi:methionine sulfoxide reductase catalytic subunit